MRNRFMVSTTVARLVAFANMGLVPRNQQTNQTAIMQMHSAVALAARNGTGGSTLYSDQTPNTPNKQPDLGARASDSAYMLNYWNLTDDLVNGLEAVKKETTKYLPKFPDEEASEYNYRLELAEMTNVYADVIETLAAKPFEEECSLIAERDEETGDPLPLPKEFEEFTEDVDGAGSTLTTFASHVFYNGLNSAVHWIYVDYPTIDPTVVRSVADQKAAGIKPYWSHVLGRNVLDCKSEMINSAETLTYIRILEPGDPDNVRIFVREPDGTITWSLWEKNLDQTSDQKWINLDGGTITIDVIPLVPFTTGRRMGRTWRFKPVMEAAAEKQKSLYKLESGLNFNKTMGAYSMLAGNGVTPDKEPGGKPKRIAVGPNKVLYAPPDGKGQHGEWTYIQPSAEIMKFLSDDVKSSQDQLRDLGKMPLTAQSGNLTVITTAFAAGKAKSAVGAMCINLKNTLEKALLITGKWIGDTTYEPAVNVYDEFDDFSSDKTNDYTALNTMRSSGDLSQDTYWHEMKRRGLLSSEFNAKQETMKLLDETPSPEDNQDNEFDPAGNPTGKKKPAKPGSTDGNGPTLTINHVAA